MKPLPPPYPTLRVVGLFLLALGFAPCSRAANVTVDATQTVRTVDERVFGINAVMWDQDLSTDQTISLVQAAGIRVIRIPGGSLSDTYDWSVNKSYASQGVFNTWKWMSGMDSFAKLITGVDSQVFVTVNYGSGTAQEAAAWVAYCNASATLQGTAADVNLGVDADGKDWKTAGYWSAMRAASPLATDDGYNFLRLGRSAPFGFKHWEVGNECYGSWETDYHTVPHDPYTYATEFQKYVEWMKQVDPTIKVGAVVTTGEDSDANNTSHPATNPRTGVVHNGWTPVMLSTLNSLGVTPDFVVFHRYEQQPDHENDATLLQAASTWPQDAADLRQQLDDYLGASGAGVELDVTENNSVYSDPGKQTTSLVNGLYLADSVGNIMQTEFNSLVWWALRNGPPTDSSGNLLGNQSSSLYGWRQFGDYGVLSMPSTVTGETTYYDAYPTYYIFKLLSHFARGGDTVVKATSDDSLLAVYAVKRADGSLCLLVINKSPTATLTGNFSFTGYDPQSTATVYSYGMPQDNAAKNGTGSTDIATSSLSGVAAAFSTSFAPYSATVLSLSPASASPPAISTQPAGTTATSGSKVTISIAVSGSPAPSLQWQRRAVGSSTWSDLADNDTYSGTSTATLTIDEATAAMSGDAFRCVATNASGTVTSSTAVLLVNTPLTVSTLAGTAGSSGSADGTGTAARFDAPADVAVDSAGNVYVADTGNDVIRKVTSAGVVTTLAGAAGDAGSADGAGTAARFDHPSGVAVDSAGNVYVADTDNDTIRKIDSSGNVTTLAGTAGSSGSADGTGTAARFDGPSGIAVDSSGDLYVGDTLNHTIREVTAAGVVTTVAGTAGASGSTDGTGAAARFYGPQGLTLDGSGDLYVADTNNDTIRKVVLASGAVSTVAGLAGSSGSDDGVGSDARFDAPADLAMDGSGNLFVADMDNSTVREISSAGAAVTVAGSAGNSGSDDGTGDAARFRHPSGVAVDSSGNVYVADTENQTIRMVFVAQAPTITAQPSSQTVTAGDSAEFTVTATGQPAPTYQWSFNSSAISGATSAKLSLSNVQSTDAGNYSVTVSNSAGSATSNTVTLTVNAAPGGSTGGGSSSGGGGGGGGGFIEAWFGLALLLLSAARIRFHRAAD